MKNKIDFSFISRLEGGRNVDDLKKIQLSGALIEKLTPYLGLIKIDAVNKLELAPLTISSQEADEIDEASKASATQRLMIRYDAAIKSDQDQFAELPPEAQTVIASVAFQYGDLATRTPLFWQAVINQDWSKTVAILNDFHDAYPTRRRKEAELLQTIL